VCGDGRDRRGKKGKMQLVRHAHLTDNKDHTWSNSRSQIVSFPVLDGVLYARSSSWIGNLTSQLPMIFWILNSENFVLKPSICTMCVYFRDASRELSSLASSADTVLVSLQSLLANLVC
jgi:hypothetical protein